MLIIVYVYHQYNIICICIYVFGAGGVHWRRVCLYWIVFGLRGWPVISARVLVMNIESLASFKAKPRRFSCMFLYVWALFPCRTASRANGESKKPNRGRWWRERSHGHPTWASAAGKLACAATRQTEAASVRYGWFIVTYSIAVHSYIMLHIILVT